MHFAIIRVEYSNTNPLYNTNVILVERVAEVVVLSWVVAVVLVELVAVVVVVVVAAAAVVTTASVNIRNVPVYIFFLLVLQWMLSSKKYSL